MRALCACLLLAMSAAAACSSFTPADDAATDAGADAGTNDAVATELDSGLIANGGFEDAGLIKCGQGWYTTVGDAQHVAGGRTGASGCQLCITAGIDSGEGEATLQSTNLKTQPAFYGGTAYVRSATDGGATAAWIDLSVVAGMGARSGDISGPTAGYVERNAAIMGTAGGELFFSLTIKGPVGACAVWDDVALTGP